MAAKNWKATTSSAKYAMKQAENNNFLGSMWGGLRTVGTALYDTAGNLLWRGDKDISNKSTTNKSTLKDINKAYPASTVNNATKLVSNGGTSGGGYTSSSSISGTPQGVITDSLNEMLNAYNQAADATKDRAKSTYDQTVADVNRAYDTTANTLLKSIERFREQNAQNVADQRKAYLSNQAALESARSEADRQSRIEAAARGLGGSGLQQLAQLQNLISQSQDISDLATENQGTMDKLRTALSQREEDYKDDLTNAQTTRDTALTNALTNYNNTISDIEAALAQNKANANWDYGTTLSNILLRNSGGSGSSTDPYIGVVNGIVSATLNEFKDAYNSAKNDKGRQTAISNATSTLNNLLRSYGTDYSAIQTALDYVSNQKATKK